MHRFHGCLIRVYQPLVLRMIVETHNSRALSLKYTRNIRHWCTSPILQQEQPPHLDNTQVISMISTAGAAVQNATDKNTPRLGQDGTSDSSLIPELESATVPAGKTKSVPAKRIYREIRSMDSGEIMTLVKTSHQQLDRFEIALCVKQLWRHARHKEPREKEHFCHQLWKNISFQVLCSHVTLTASYQEGEIVCDMLKFLAYLGLDSDHLTIQMLLQMVKFHLDSLSLADLISLLHTVSKLSPTDQTQILMEAGHVICPNQAQLENNFVYLNIWEKVVFLDLFGKNLSEDTVHQLLRKIRGEHDSFGLRLSLLLIQALHKSGYDDVLTVRMCLTKIQPQIENLTPQEAEKVVDVLVAFDYYLPDLWNQLCAAAINQRWSLTDRVALLPYFSQQNYVNKLFVQGILDDLLSPSDEATISVEKYLQVLNSASCLPPGNITQQKSFAKSVLRHLFSTLQPLKPEEQLDHLLSCIALEGQPSSECIKENSSWTSLFEEARHLEDDITQGGRFPLATKMLLLNLQTEDAALLTQSMMDQLVEAQQQQLAGTSPLKGAVEYASEDHWQIEHDVSSPAGLHIDHCVTIPLDGKHERVAVLALPEECFGRNTGQPTALTHLYGRTLQREGYLVVLINLTSFNKVAERDKLAYLQKRISCAKIDQELILLGMDCL